MRIHVCGVRGSTPAPGPEFVRYGGHTACLAIAHDGATTPTLVLDAGTGIRRVTGLLDGAPFQGTIVLSHLHWDHTQGLPFFAGGDRPDARVRVLLPTDGEDPLALLSRTMAPPHFPIDPAGLQGRWSFEGLGPGRHDVEGFRLTVVELPHKGGTTFGIRVEDDRSALAYVPDHGPLALGPGPDGLGERHADACSLVEGVDLLVHDAQHTADELPRWAHFGHSAVEYAVALADVAGARRLALFHHGPGRTDDELDALVGRLGRKDVEAAAEGDVWDTTTCAG